VSDDYLRIVPVEMEFVPATESHEAAIELLEEFFPDGEECEVEVYETVQFIDQGENLEAVICPACRKVNRINFLEEGDAGASFWLELSERFEAEEVSEIAVHMLCCNTKVPFTSLTFDWPAAFARFELSVRNPDSTEDLTESQLASIEQILGCKLKQVRAHY
jgi:hypothetical protein